MEDALGGYMDRTVARLIIQEMIAGLTPDQLIQIIRTMDTNMLEEALKGCPQPDCIFCNAARDTIASRNETLAIH